jgi:hypothetical protein
MRPLSLHSELARLVRLDGRGSILGRAMDFSLLRSVQIGSDAHPASYPVSSWMKRPGSQADHSPSSNAEVKNGAAIPTLRHTSS